MANHFIIQVALSVIVQSVIVSTTGMIDMQRPRQWIQLVNGKMIIDTEVQNLLKSIDLECAVISTAGEARTGKSYFLNQLMGQNHGFSVGSTVKAETKGIWIWVRPHPYLRNTALVLLDTEGLDHTDKSNVTQDTMIFALALLSSNLVYNIKENIVSNDLLKLESVVKLVKFMSGKTSAQHESPVFAPHLTMVIQDFFLYLVNDRGEQITAEQYLKEQILALNDHQPSKITDIKVAIKEYFPSQSLHTIVSPVDDRKSLRELDNMPLSSINREYIQQLKNLKEQLLGSGEVLRIKGKAVSLSTWAEMADMFIKEMNRQNLEGVVDIPDSIEKKVNQRAADNALKICTRYAQPSEVQQRESSGIELWKYVDKVKDEVLQEYKRQSFGSEDADDSFKSELDSCIGSIERSWEHENTKRDNINLKNRQDNNQNGNSNTVVKLVKTVALAAAFKLGGPVTIVLTGLASIFW